MVRLPRTARARSTWARALLGAVCLGAFVALGAPRTAAADEPRTRDLQPFMGGNGLYDLGFVAATSGVLLGGTFLLAPPRVDRAPLDGLGRREISRPLGRAGDASLRLGLGVGAGLAFLTELGQDARGRGLVRAPLIMAEGALAASAFTQLLKNAFGVCRPRDWDPVARRCSPTVDSEPGLSPEEREDEARRSFPSGHNAPLAGMAGAAMGLYLLPSPRRPEYLPVALTSTGFALTTVLLRERAGAHSWVDTLAAFAAGGAAGFATAALHLKSTRVPSSDPAGPIAAPQAAPTWITFGGPF